MTAPETDLATSRAGHGTRRRLLLLVLGLALWALAEAALLALRADRIPLLLDGAAARWILVDDGPVQLAARPYQERWGGFLRVFQLDRPAPGETRVHVQAHAGAKLFINGVALAELPGPAGTTTRWTGDLGPHLRPGENRLLVFVGRDNGPPLLRVDATLAALNSSGAWLASSDGRRWSPAREAAAPRHTALSSASPSPAEALLQRWAPLLAWFGVGALATVALQRGSARLPLLHTARAVRALRWAMLLGLAALFWHNFDRLDLRIGMDLRAHLQYVDFILSRHALPLATDGWQMFQPPLAHGALAGTLALAQWAGLAPDPAATGRALAMGACLLATYFGARIVERVYQGNGLLQVVGIVVAALLPASITMAHAFGNEPVLAAVAAAALFVATQATAPVAGQPRWRHALLLGGLCGLALLAKTSAVIIAAVLGAALVMQRPRADGRTAAREGAAFAAACALVSGWWYLRNVVELGRPFIGGWEAGRGIDWWQHPGFRTPGQLLGFGEALTQPVYAGLSGFWDGLYSSLWLDGYFSGIISLEVAPRWDLPAMATLALLALPWTVAIAVGAVRAALGIATHAALAASATLLALFLMAMLHLYASVPIYSAAKGSYLLSLAPCLGLLAASGVAPLLRWPWLRPVVGGLLLMWAGSVFGTFVG